MKLNNMELRLNCSIKTSNSSCYTLMGHKERITIALLKKAKNKKTLIY